MVYLKSFLTHLLQTILTVSIAILIGEIWYQQAYISMAPSASAEQLTHVIKITNLYGLIVPFTEAFLIYLLFFRKNFAKKTDFFIPIIFLFFSYAMFLCARSGSIFITSMISGKGVSDTIELNNPYSYLNSAILIILLAFLRFSTLVMIAKQTKQSPQK
jgi:hypothetical protein